VLALSLHDVKDELSQVGITNLTEAECGLGFFRVSELNFMIRRQLMSLLRSRVLAPFLMLAMLCCASQAGTIPLGSFMGTTVSFNDLIENDGDPLSMGFPSLFNPTGTAGDMLLFNPTNFAISSGGASPQLDHSLSFSVVAKPGETFDTVTIEEAFQAFTDGPGSLVSAFFGGPGNTLDPVVVNASGTVASGPNAGAVSLTPAPLVYTFPTPVTRADFTIDNRLIAVAPPQSFASIEKTGFKITVGGVVPEPTTAMIFACGFAGVIGARRRRR